MRATVLSMTIVFAGSAMLLSGERAEQKPLWHADWATAQRIARKLNRPIFAVLVCQH